jgi:hypothetical protein
MQLTTFEHIKRVLCLRREDGAKADCLSLLGRIVTRHTSNHPPIVRSTPPEDPSAI